MGGTTTNISSIAVGNIYIELGDGEQTNDGKRWIINHQPTSQYNPAFDRDIVFINGVGINVDNWEFYPQIDAEPQWSNSFFRVYFLTPQPDTNYFVVPALNEINTSLLKQPGYFDIHLINWKNYRHVSSALDLDYYVDGKSFSFAVYRYN